MKQFIGRKAELKTLKKLIKSGKAVMVVIKGRRRIGKSYLAAEFGKDKVFLPFTGLAPIEGVTEQNQRDLFAGQFSQNFKSPTTTFLDWQNAFYHLSSRLTQEPTVILFDEISWMGSKDPTFLPTLKAWWDLTMPQFPNLTLILCGSVSTWIEENIIKSTAFFGRISLHITLEELSLSESMQLLKQRGFKGSTYDVFKILSITGGVPWYLDQIEPSDTVDDNIKRLCFHKDGLLVGEFDLIFNDLFGHRGDVFKKIIYVLGNGMRDLQQIRNALKYPNSGRLSEYLRVLNISGFVTQHHDWSLKTGKMGRRSLYRLSDNYLRFYMKYIEPNLPKVQKKAYDEFNLSAIPGWETMIVFQVENLLLNNRYLILKSLDVHPHDIVADNPYIQRAGARQKGCQIDYLVHTHSNNLFICEFKFQRKELSSSVIDSMEDKLERFAAPKGFGICPVLFCLGDVAEEVHNRRYFYRIIDIADFLEGE